MYFPGDFMPRVVNLTDSQQQLLQAGEPPQSSAFVGDSEWWAAQDRWYALAVDGTPLPAPPSASAQRRKLWQHATTRYWRAHCASLAAIGSLPAVAARASEASRRAQRKRTPYTRRVQTVIVAVGRKQAPIPGAVAPRRVCVRAWRSGRPAGRSAQMAQDVGVV